MQVGMDGGGEVGGVNIGGSGEAKSMRHFSVLQGRGVVPAMQQQQGRVLVG